MVTTVFLIRHCEAEANVMKRFQGHHDGGITQRGELQLEKLSERCKSITFDLICSSPLKRAFLTAQAANRYHNLPIHLYDGLKEINGGILEGYTWDELPEKYPEYFSVWQNDICNFSAPEGESFRQVYDRMRDTILDIVSKNSGANIGIFSHGGAIRTFLCYAHGYPVERLDDCIWCDNTGITRIEFDEKLMPTIIYENDCEHINSDEHTKVHKIWW